MYSASSSASSSAKASNTFDSSGWVNNYGNAQAVPTWALIGALVLGAFFVFKRGRS